MIKEIILTHEGLSRLGLDNDFELRTDRKSVGCNKSQIRFISPLISNLLLSDPTIESFQLETPESSKCSEILRNLLNGSKISITEDQSRIFRAISLELGNDELFSLINDDISIKNAIEINQIKYNLSLNSEKEIEFVASHFYEISPKDISSLDISVIESILSSESLVISSERELFEFIKDLVTERGDEFRFLLSYLHLEYLDVDDILYVIESIDEDNTKYFLPCMFRRLICPLANYQIQERDLERYFCAVQYNKDKFDGIFSHLWRMSDGNPVTNGIISIEDTTDSDQYGISCIIDPEKRNQTDWWCGNENYRSAAFIFDFKEMRASINGYSLKAHSESFSTGHFIRSWKVEGSNDKATWEIVDQRCSNKLQTNLAESYFSCQQSHFFRFLRIMMTDTNTDNGCEIALHAIELFGLLLMVK